MSRRYSGWVSLLVVVVFLLACSLASAAEFTAKLSAKAGNQSFTGVVYIKGQNVRQEVTANNRTQITILNAQKKMLWHLDPAAKTYVAVPIPPQQLTSAGDQARGRLPANLPKQGLTVKRLGTEKVNGYSCDKTLIQGSGGRTTVWFSKQLDFAIKAESSQTRGKQTVTSRQEYTNIKERKLPDSLFLPPAGYRQVTPQATPGPGGRMPGRGGMMPPARRGR